MIVQRNTFKVKPGKGPELVEMLKAADEKTGWTDKTRIYTSNIGPFHVIAYEMEFENLAQLDGEWAEWWSHPDTPAFMEKWNEIVESGGGAEIWDLVE